MLRNINRLAALFLVLFLSVGCDQASKVVAQRTLASSEPISLWNNLVRFEYVENPGAFLSLGAALPEETRQWIFIGIVGIILLVTFIVAVRSHGEWPLSVVVALAMVIGGGSSNLLSRLMHDGHVIDYVNVGIGWLRTGTFNIADMSIMGGVIFLTLYGLRTPPSESHEEPSQSVT